MKTLLIFAVILGIIFLYFVVNAEKSILVKGNEVVPIGTDVPKLILNKVKELTSAKSADNIIDFFQPKTAGIIQNLISGGTSKITDLIKEPVKNKINEILCPVK